MSFPGPSLSGRVSGENRAAQVPCCFYTLYPYPVTIYEHANPMRNMVKEKRRSVPHPEPAVKNILPACCFTVFHFSLSPS
jgi:hypothetical protein